MAPPSSTTSLGLALAAATAAAALLPLPASAQGGEVWPVTPQMRADASAVISAALAPENNSSAWNRIAYVSDTFGGRLSGSATLEAAIDWIAAQARADGLNVTEEPVMVPHWVRGREYAFLESPRVKALHMAGIGGSIGTNGTNITAPVLVVRSYEELQNRSSEAVGKIVVFNQDFVDYGTTVAYRYNGATWAAQFGGLAALVRSVSPFTMQLAHTGVGANATVPSACISIEDAMQLQRMQDRGQNPVVTLYMEGHFEPDAPSRNLIIDIPGSQTPDEYVIVSGHIDCWDISEGAMDDGGGAFAAWEALRLLKTLGIQMNRTVRAVLWTNEENGERGAEAFATDYASTLGSISFGIESDSGTFAPYGLSFAGNATALAQLQLIGQQLLQLAPLYSGNVSAGIVDTDIGVLSALGVPSAGWWDLDPRSASYANSTNNPCSAFSQSVVIPATLEVSSGYLFYHHTAADTVDKLDPTQLQMAAASMAVWASSVANLPGMLQRT
jgi:carboxypeptidase Q